MQQEPARATQSVTLVVTWRGGRGIDLISIRHNGRPIPYEHRRIEVERSAARIEYEVPSSRCHEVRAVFSFIGDVRTSMELHCLVDGATAGGPIHAPRVEHRWEIRGSWS